MAGKKKKPEVVVEEPVVAASHSVQDEGVEHVDVFPLLFLEGARVVRTSLDPNGRYHILTDNGRGYILPKVEYDHNVEKNNKPL